MPRLRQVPRDEVASPSVLAQYDRLFRDGDPIANPGTKTGSPGNWWSVFAAVPEIVDHVVSSVQFYTDPKRKLSPQIRELGQVRAGWLNGSKFVYSQHCKAARATGLTDEKIAAVREWQVADCFTEKERTALVFVDYLVGQRGRVPDAVFAKLKAHFSDEEILELTYVTALYDLHSIVARALRLEFDDYDDPVVEVPAPK
jgi:alkylhydroperoxidase family enzyme